MIAKKSLPPLTEYRRKRDFSKTTEPVGNDNDSILPHEGIFVVQKHAARQLHFDFRLELDGILKSWAIPKGPSLDPVAKRLAVHVEDHPLEYAQFEGIIPEKAYGAGTVMVWDRGLWQPVGDGKEGYNRGVLKFILQGEKLRGLWTLIRLKKQDGAISGKENWLLIKDRDEMARSGADAEITVLLPDSVLSGKSMEEIAASEPT